MRTAFLTVGDPTRLTGGYLYHVEVFRRMAVAGHHVTQIVLSGASIEAQLAGQAGAGALVDAADYDVLLVDALARIVCAPWLAVWQQQRPIVAMVHELPGVAGSRDEREPDWIAPLLRAERLITVSADGAATLAAQGVAPQHITIASGGRDRLAALRPRRRATGRIVLCVAQWIERKGLIELIGAWRRARLNGWQLVLAGECDADAAYAQQVRTAVGGDRSIRVLGAVSDAVLASWYTRAQLFALATHFEGYGLVFAEAIDAGLPILAGAVGPVPGLVGAAGITVRPDDSAALTAALQQLCSDGRLRRHLARAAQQRAHALPGWDTTTAWVLAALQAAVMRRKPSRA